MGKNIFESVIDMRNDEQSITEYLNSVIEEGYYVCWEVESCKY
jgi:hypothetical protein